MSTPVYVVTDIEVDGPWPGPHSMRSFASVAVSADGEVRGEFTAVLEPLPGAQPNPDTYAWFQTVPEAWAAATREPRHFVASPLGFDGTWIDHYLRQFTTYGVCQGPYETDRLFDGPGVCLHSLACGVVGGDPADFSVHRLPRAWFGEVPHTHAAVDDARGYAHLLVEVLRRRAESAPTM